MKLTPNALITIDQLIAVGRKMYDKEVDDLSSRMYNLAIVHVIADAAGLKLSEFDEMRKTLESKHDQ